MVILRTSFLEKMYSRKETKEKNKIWKQEQIKKIKNSSRGKFYYNLVDKDNTVFNKAAKENLKLGLNHMPSKMNINDIIGYRDWMRKSGIAKDLKQELSIMSYAPGGSIKNLIKKSIKRRIKKNDSIKK